MRIRAELAQRGIDGRRAAAALDEAGLDWATLAATALAKKFGRSAPATLEARAKQTRYLEYRGFTADQIRAAFGQLGEPG